MRQISIYFFKLALLTSICLNVYAQDSRSKLIKAMQSKGHILMIRHAIAPGFGDPDNIKIGDCNTQRNLNHQGRKQSREIGSWISDNGIKPSAIYSSQWCRCLDTARLLNLGKVEELKALNSFFQMPQNRDANLSALKEFMVNQIPDNNLIIMVTHSVTISAISGQNVASGNGVLIKLNQSAPYEIIGVVNPSLIK